MLYGGSVTPENFPELLGIPEVAGGLVGGASLDPAKFAELARQAG
ncbi:MAG TPA: triose-phosphate isomerase [Holophagaceae bacterium]